MKRPILLTGKNGQLGFELQRALAPLGAIVAVDRSDCDLADTDALRELVRAVRPGIIVNPAAYTAVDKAENDRAAAMAVNAVAPGVLGEEAARIGAGVIHYSTDYVFDGRQAEPYREEDTANPLGVYGRSKLQGEVALRESGVRSLILRTSWVAGAHGANFAKTILRLASERETLDVVADQHGAPTSAALLADVTAQLIGHAMREGEEHFPFGLYHLCASGSTTWHAYARHVVASALNAGAKLRLQPENIRAITSAEYPMAAARPANSCLNTEKFRNAFSLYLPEWQAGIDHLLAQIL